MGACVRIQNVIVPNGDETTASISQAEKVLEAKIRGGRVVSVQWGGVDVVELRDGPQTQDTVEPLPRGRFGVVNYAGTSRYRDARFQLVSEGLLAK